MTSYIGTYTCGLHLKTERIITKNDIITMCKLLNSKDIYSNLCEFEPEGISEGGIVYKFKNCFDNEWYKSVRLGINYHRNGYQSKGVWYWINKNIMTEWYQNNDIIFNENNYFTIFLKSFHGAPLFTVNELKIWEECFNEIGIVNVGKYPNKKSLINKKLKG